MWFNIVPTTSGEYRQAMLSAPIDVIPGDEVWREGSKLYRKRIIEGGELLSSRDILESTEVVVPGPIEVSGTFDRVTYFKEFRMAAVATTITNVSTDPSGAVFADFSNGGQRELTVAGMEAIADALDANVELAQDILIAKLIRLEPQLDNPDILNGSTVSIDTAGNTPIIYTGSN